MLKTFISIYFLFLMGCAAALVPESNSPRTKINQATVLFNKQGRPVGAVSILKQAIPLAQKQNDKNSEAEAEFYLGEIYKSPGPRGVDLKKPNEAIRHYNRAIILYKELKLYKKSAFVSWNKSGAYGMIPNKKGKCSSLREAKKLHEKPGAAAGDKLPSPYSNGNLLKSIGYLLKKNNC